MTKRINVIAVIIFSFLIAIIFNSWFSFSSLSSGDWSYKFPEAIRDFTLYPYAWDVEFSNGLGGTKVFLLALNTYYLSSTGLLFNFFHIPFLIIERVLWFWPFLIISVFSSYYLFKKLFSNKFSLLASLVYLFNTYILMIVGGGQMGIAMAYALAPLVLNSFIKAVDVGLKNYDLRKNIKYPIIAGLLFSLQIVFDLRIAYITLAAVAVYAILSIINYVFSKESLRKKIFYILNFIFYIFIVPGTVTFLLNSFWLLPTIINHRNPIEDLGQAYSSLEAVKFFSFAKLEDSLSFLHPNWPENIFGKVGFMKPEFLLLPILAYSSLLFVSIKQKIENKKQRTYILYFALLGLIGAFLAKGANEPFGQIYLWLFDNFPGFIMFRDPTKWYTLVAISYSILIPFAVWQIYEWLKSHSRFKTHDLRFMTKNRIVNIQNLFILLLISYLLFLIRPALLGQLSGTFKSVEVPNDYIKLEEFLSSSNNFSRTLWVPTLQRFGFYSNSHPAIPAQNLFKTVDYSQILKNLRMPGTEVFLQEAAVKYVIVPYDSQGEIFLKDRKYDDKLYQQAVRGVSKIPWLKPVDCSIAKLLNCTGNPFGKIKVFEVHPPAGGPKDHFYFKDLGSKIKDQSIKYQYLSPVEYKLEVKNAKKDDVVVFSESYDKNWIAKTPNYTLNAKRYGLFNSFVLPADGNYSLRVYYTSQDYVNIGMIISVASLVLILGALIYLRKKKI